GRKENVGKLLKLRELTNCKILYLIEGNPIPNDNKHYGKIPTKQLRAHLDHLMIRDSIHIINSHDQENSAKRIFELIRNFSTIKPSMFKDIIDNKPYDETKTEVKLLADDDNDNYKVDDKIDDKVDDKVDKANDNDSDNDSDKANDKANDNDSDKANDNDNNNDNNNDDKVDVKTNDKVDTINDDEADDKTDVIDFMDLSAFDKLITKSKTKDKKEPKAKAKKSKVDKPLIGGASIEDAISTDVSLLNTIKIGSDDESIACQEQFLTCLPTVGRVMSVLMANAGITLSKLYHDMVPAAFIAGLQYDTGACIGLTKANRILDNRPLFSSRSKKAIHMQVKILKSIKGISLNT
ncbi:hypothetical protein EBX93_18775, partial [bacterium]|nr:hypothetical protein [bacterium]